MSIGIDSILDSMLTVVGHDEFQREGFEQVFQPLVRDLKDAHIEYGIPSSYDYDSICQPVMEMD